MWYCRVWSGKGRSQKTAKGQQQRASGARSKLGRKKASPSGCAPGNTSSVCRCLQDVLVRGVWISMSTLYTLVCHHGVHQFPHKRMQISQGSLGNALPPPPTIIACSHALQSVDIFMCICKFLVRIYGQPYTSVAIFVSDREGSLASSGLAILSACLARARSRCRRSPGV